MESFLGIDVSKATLDIASLPNGESGSVTDRLDAKRVRRYSLVRHPVGINREGTL